MSDYKKDLTEKCRQLLYNSITNYFLPENTANFLLDLFKLHPEWESKKGGLNIKGVIIRRHPQYKNKCFALVREDGSVVDISFTECINRPGIKKDVILACSKLYPAESINEKEFKNKIEQWAANYTYGFITIAQHIQPDGTFERTTEEELKNFMC